LKQAQLLDNKKKQKELAKQFLNNKAEHYAKIVEETQNYWSSYYKDCFLAAEQECLKSGNLLAKY
tara:strand:+ start:235 stop:429 length:195 start_codon:yes stop_codon:yes gene_type:complete